MAAVLALAGALAGGVGRGEAARPVAVAVKLVPDAGGASLTFDLSRPVDARAYTLSSPDRIVVDLPEVVFQIDPAVGASELRATAAPRQGVPVRASCARQVAGRHRPRPAGLPGRVSSRSRYSPIPKPPG